MQVFTANLKKIQEHNSKNGSVRLGINKFADLSREEFKKMLGYKSKYTYGIRPEPTLIEAVNLPQKVDWREKGAVT